MRIYQAAIFIMLCCTIFSCNNKHFDESVENMNKGELDLYADESYRGIMDELVKSYENVYPESKIRINYASENEVLKAMLNGTTHMIVTGKKLTPAEFSKIEQTNKMQPTLSVVAKEAIAIITSINNPDSVFDFDAFLTIQSGRGDENYVNKKYVFVKGQSSFVNQITGNAAEKITNMFSLDKTDTLINYISKTSDSYGFISFAQISDTDEPATKELLKKIKVMYVAQNDSSGAKKVYDLSQSSIAANEYPLQRSITVVKGNMSQSLGTGFVNFMYRSKASRIFLKAGLIPVVMPGREILIKEE